MPNVILSLAKDLIVIILLLMTKVLLHQDSSLRSE